jgi:preprotein translocase subunit YajC
VEALGTLLPFIAIAAIFWFLLIRPQRRRQMEMVATQRAASVGDEVMLGAGIVGRVASASDEFLELEISPGVLMKVARGAVVRVLQPEGLTDEASDPEQPSQRPDPTDPTDPTDPSRDH